MIRREVFRLRAWPAAALACLALTGCSAGGGPSEESTPPQPKPLPEAGQCYDAAPDAISEHIDTSSPVDCAERHTLETMHVITTEEPITPANVDQHASTCRNVFEEYVGDIPEVSRLALHFVVTDEDTQEAGQHWLRCDVMEAADSQGEEAEARTGSVQGALADDVPARFRACLDTPPDPEANQPFVDCSEPHIAELLDEAAVLGQPDDAYPGPERLAALAERECTKLTRQANYPDYIDRDWVYPTEPGWTAGDRAAACWVSATLPPVGKDMRHPDADANPD